MHSSHYHAYKLASHTVAKTRQIVMLYDGAIRFLQQARDAMAAKRIEERFHLLTKVSAILNGLQSSLDFDTQPDMAQSLYDFYGDLEAKIVELHRSNDADACLVVIEQLRDMRNIWDEIDRQGTTSSPSVETPPLPDSTSPAEIMAEVGGAPIGVSQAAPPLTGIKVSA